MTPPEQQIHVLGGFRMFLGGRTISAPVTVAKLIALLAVSGRPMSRSQIAGAIWPMLTEQRATANLRSVVWRLSTTVRAFVDASGPAISLAETVGVDLDDVGRVVRSILDANDPVPASDSIRDVVGSPWVQQLCSPLLPEWDDDWLVFERERIRQLHIHALERLAEWQLASGDPLSAVDVGIATIAAEPLRESAHILVIRAHLAAGNRLDARRCFDRYRDVLKREMNVAPAVSWTDLTAAARASDRERRVPGVR